MFLNLSCINNFSDGERYFSEKDYTSAVIHYKLVPPDSKHYNEAQRKLILIDSATQRNYFNTAVELLNDNNLLEARNTFYLIDSPKSYFDTVTTYLAKIDSLVSADNIQKIKNSDNNSKTAAKELKEHLKVLYFQLMAFKGEPDFITF
jgi:hypothetical protein